MKENSLFKDGYDTELTTDRTLTEAQITQMLGLVRRHVSGLEIRASASIISVENSSPVMIIRGFILRGTPEAL